MAVLVFGLSITFPAQAETTKLAIDRSLGAIAGNGTFTCWRLTDVPEIFVLENVMNNNVADIVDFVGQRVHVQTKQGASVPLIAYHPASNAIKQTAYLLYFTGSREGLNLSMDAYWMHRAIYLDDPSDSNVISGLIRRRESLLPPVAYCAKAKKTNAKSSDFPSVLFHNKKYWHPKQYAQIATVLALKNSNPLFPARPSTVPFYRGVPSLIYR